MEEAKHHERGELLCDKNLIIIDDMVALADL